MYKIVFFKFFLFVLYMTAGLVSKFNSRNSDNDDYALSSKSDDELLMREIERNAANKNSKNSKNANLNMINMVTNNNRNRPQDPNQIGQATLWVNPFVTRFKKPTTTRYTTTTTTTTTRRTARPRPRVAMRLAATKKRIIGQKRSSASFSTVSSSTISSTKPTRRRSRTSVVY